ncbi:MAG: NADH:flavin oxidoreductase, partial [Planctomycetaceae bacterium]|nr:NADH:flavin oxidoreductase [Planctomycetaceae bacterium]
MSYRRVAAFKSTPDFRAYLETLGLSEVIDEEPLSADQGSPLAQPIAVQGFEVGNRWAVHPMEGWDGTLCGKPTAET